MASAVTEGTDTETDNLIVAEDPAYLRDFLRPILLPYVQRNSIEFIPWFQQACGILPPKKEKVEDGGANAAQPAEAWQDSKSPILTRLKSALFSLIFHFGSMLGNEIIYITFFPFMFWNIDCHLARRLVYLWSITMYLGQGLKDHLKLPRPSVCSSKVRSMESLYIAEYGFPSTHVMAIMGQAFMIVIYTYRIDYAGKGEYPIFFALFIATVITLVTAASRLYMGVHSVPDLLGGITMTVAIIWIFISFDNYLDEWLQHSAEGLYVPTLFFIALLLTYPRARKFTVTYGDTAMIAGVANGCAIASNIVNRWGFDNIPLDWLHVPLQWWLAYAFGRAAIGFVIMVSVRQIFKALCVVVLAKALPSSPAPNNERYSIVVPTKFITYTAVSMSSLTLCVAAFNLVGLTISNLQALHPIE